MNSDDRVYAVVWFEGDDIYTLVDDEGHTVLISKDQAKNEVADVLDTEFAVDEADEDLRYAIPASLLESMFGWTS